MSLDVASVRQRLSWLDRYVAELKRHQATTVEELKVDFTAQLAVERAFQAAVESCTDVASLVVSANTLGQPQEQRDLFRLLAQAGYLDAAFGSTMAQLVDFRNWLVHSYWEVEAERLHQHLQLEVAPLERFRDFVLQLVVSAEGSSD